MPKLTKTGYEIGSSEAGAIVLFKTAFQFRDEVLENHKLARAGVESVDKPLNKNALRRGTHLEPSVATWAAEDLMEMTGAHVEMQEPKVAFRREDLRIASSVDRIVTLSAPLVLSEPDGTEVVLQNKGICEIKTDFYHDDKPKPEWKIQVLHQMLCTGMRWGLIACMCQRGKMHYYPVTYNQHLIDRMIEAYAEFWHLVDTDGTYPPITTNEAGPVELKTYDEGVTTLLKSMADDYLKAGAEARRWSAVKEESKKAIMQAMDNLEVEHGKIENFVIKAEVKRKEKKRMVGTGEFAPSTSFSIKEVG